MIFGSFSKSLGAVFGLELLLGSLVGRSGLNLSKETKQVEWITTKADSINRLLAQFPDDAVIDDTVAEQVREAKDLAEHVLPCFTQVAG